MVKINKLSNRTSIPYHPYLTEISAFVMEKESAAYHACSFKINYKLIIYRTAKITPTKIGQFVTIWKRDVNQITAPFDVDDDFDFVIINCAYENFKGQFIFPKSVLLDKKIISGSNSSGKRGIRVYPEWDVSLSKQAQESQKWQLLYFYNFSTETELNNSLVKLDLVFK